MFYSLLYGLATEPMQLGLAKTQRHPIKTPSRRARVKASGGSISPAAPSSLSRSHSGCQDRCSQAHGGQVWDGDF